MKLNATNMVPLLFLLLVSRYFFPGWSEKHIFIKKIISHRWTAAKWEEKEERESGNSFPSPAATVQSLLKFWVLQASY